MPAPHPDPFLPATSEGESEKPLVSHRALQIATAMFTLGFGVLIVYGAIEYKIGWDDRGPEPGYFPFWIGLIICASSVVTLVQALIDHRTEAAITTAQARRALAFLVPMIAFLLVTTWAGLYVATALYLFSAMIWQGGYRLPAALAVSLGTVAAFYLTFDKWLKVPLKMGPIERWLGLG